MAQPSNVRLVTEKSLGYVGDGRITHGFIHRLQRGTDDATILVVGDSLSDYANGLTGSSPLRWPIQLASLFATDYPIYTVVWYQWLDASGSSTSATAAPFSWSTPQVLTTGTAGMRTDTVTGSAASNTITDASIGSGDVGKSVIGLNIPPHAKVGTVSAGVSFTLVDPDGKPLYPWAAITSARISAAPVLAVWNSATNGTRLLYEFGANSTRRIAEIKPDMMILAHGMNEFALASATNGQTVFRSDYQAGCEMLLEACPETPLIVCLTNPRTDASAAEQGPKSRIIEDYAQERGFGVADVYQVFLSHGTWAADWMTDALHPNDAGYAAWAQEVYEIFRPPIGHTQPTQIAKSLLQTAPAEVLNSNPLLLDWTLGVPNGWTTSNATVTYDAASGMAKIVATGLAGYAQVTLDPTQLQGKWITASVRMKYDSGTDPYLVGQLEINYVDVNGATVQLNSSVPSQVANGLHSGFGGTFTQAISGFIPVGATAVRLRMHGDSSTVSGVAFYVSRVVITKGREVAGAIPSQTATPQDRGVLAGPAGTVAVTYDRTSASDTNIGLPALGSCLVTALPILRDCTITTSNFRTGGTAGAGTAGNVHQWVAILDNNGTVVAVTADQLLTTMGLASKFSWNFTTPTALKAGLYRFCLLVSMNTTQPNVLGINTSSTASEAPILAGVGSTAQTTPPTVGGTLSLPASATATRQFAWLT